MLIATLKTGPSSEPITLQEAKDHLLVTSSLQNDYITGLIVTARRNLERLLKRAFISQTWTAYADKFECEFCLPYPPLISVTSVKYYNLDGTITTLDPLNYWVVINEEPGEVVKRYNVTYPQLEYGRPNAIEIEYVAGYTVVPEEIKQAMKLLLTDWFEHRGSVVIGNINTKIPNYVLDLVHSYKMYSF